MRLSGAESAFKGTQATVVCRTSVGKRKVAIAGEDTVFPVYDTGNKVAFLIYIRNAVLVNLGLGRGAELRPYGVKDILYFSHFVHGDGRAGIAFNAAPAFACLKVAAEIFGYNVKVDDDIVHHQNITKGWVVCHVESDIRYTK
jgi:hypothetical protein